MSDVRVAGRYAKSLLDLAVERGSVEEVHADMLLFTKTVTENRDLGLALSNPIIKGDKKQIILKSIFGGKVSELTMAFFDILTKKSREAILTTVATEFVNQYNLLKGIVRAYVTTATPLTADLREQITGLVAQQTGKQVELHEKVDATLIGGYILRVGDRQIDDSIRNGIRKLRATFKENPYVNQLQAATQEA
jgi:F-type H+-transporting ATPase subunit delta